MAAADATFPTPMLVKTARSPSPSPWVQTTAATSTPTTRRNVQASGIVARPRPWKAKPMTMLMPRKG